MPKNKKPRKKYRRKVFLVDPYSITPENSSAIKKEFEMAQLAAEVKLGKGGCTKEEMWKIRDMFNLVTIAWATRSNEELDLDAINEIQPDFLRAQNDVADVTKRGFERAEAEGLKTPIFVCRGKQISSILEGLRICGEFLDYSLKYTPQRLIKEHLAVKDLLKGKEGKYSVTQDALERAIERVTIERTR